MSTTFATTTDSNRIQSKRDTMRRSRSFRRTKSLNTNGTNHRTTPAMTAPSNPNKISIAPRSTARSPPRRFGSNLNDKENNNREKDRVRSPLRRCMSIDDPRVAGVVAVGHRKSLSPLPSRIPRTRSGGHLAAPKRLQRRQTVQSSLSLSDHMAKYNSHPKKNRRASYKEQQVALGDSLTETDTTWSASMTSVTTGDGDYPYDDDGTIEEDLSEASSIVTGGGNGSGSSLLSDREDTITPLLSRGASCRNLAAGDGSCCLTNNNNSGGTNNKRSLRGAMKRMDSFRGNCSFRSSIKGRGLGGSLMDDSSAGIDLLDESIIDNVGSTGRREADMVRLSLSASKLDLSSASIDDSTRIRTAVQDVVHKTIQDSTFARNVGVLQKQAETRCETYVKNVQFIQEKTVENVHKKAETGCETYMKNVQFIQEETVKNVQMQAETGCETYMKNVQFIQEKTVENVQLLQEKTVETTYVKNVRYLCEVSPFARNLQYLRNKAKSFGWS